MERDNVKTGVAGHTGIPAGACGETGCNWGEQALELYGWALQPDSSIWGGTVEAAIGEGAPELALSLLAALLPLHFLPGSLWNGVSLCRASSLSLMPMFTVVFSEGGGRPGQCVGPEAPACCPPLHWAVRQQAVCRSSYLRPAYVVCTVASAVCT